MIRVNVEEGMMAAFLNDTNGPIARELERVADEIVVQEAKDALLAVKQDKFLNPVVDGEHVIPRWKTGDLARKVRSIPPEVDNDGLVVYVITDPDHGEGIYSIKLLDDGYRFLPERPYYHYNGETSD